ncbi:uncharacterized protein F4822DRAFT_419324 [Hypoxylon trugodes]|uniref:uncharacterized protein n=1 Tax=Hypoxylon trugodes TaxID=326681 RepID=UPI0021951BC0|nr:uncharacterized protein F4822DRAFT_419324 [Hypoxylon trugodes]KAI1384317.1 hypothetical protein F4822DRAFT_419324 [Hypoxylon trugodes]
MCFGSSDNNNDPAPKPAQVQLSYNNTANPTASMPQDYAPPPGPPPSHQRQGHTYQSQSSSNDYTPPPGPPPSHNYAPPAGPPPQTSSQASPLPSKNNPFFNNTSNSGDTEYAPPPGPPPNASSQDQKQKQHDWQTAVPDTSLLPPPPNFFSGFDRSPANNATEEECEAGESWCASYPLYTPMPLNPAAEAAAREGNIAIYAPPFFRGTLTQLGPGFWQGTSPRGGSDASLATYPPVYHAAAHSPLVTGRARKTAYYEIRILERGSRKEVSLALGFAAPPYPAFRLPGWHRGSLGVHGDDGHRYVNDRWGGKTFTSPFKRGETLGLGMDFLRRGNGIGVEIFLTRNGVEVGRWDLHEETDQQQDLPVTGLEGYHDVCASVGVFDEVAFEVVFAPGRWLWRGYQG